MNKQSAMNCLLGARTTLLAAIEDLGETEIITLPVAGSWTIWDILAHIGGWAAWDLAGIKSIMAGEHPNLSVIQDVDSFNAQLVAGRSGWSLKQILAEMENTQTAMHELLDSLSDEEMFSIGLFKGPYWHNLAEWLKIAWEHEEEHAAQIRAWREKNS
jgi:hypothetical protein